jgi:hypothetical protein
LAGLADDVILAVLAKSGSPGFTTFGGTIYVNDFSDAETLVHEATHVVDDRAQGLPYFADEGIEFGIYQLHLSGLISIDPYATPVIIPLVSSTSFYGLIVLDSEFTAQQQQNCAEGNGCSGLTRHIGVVK